MEECTNITAKDANVTNEAQILAAPMIESLQNYGISASKNLINTPCILNAEFRALTELCSESKIQLISINEGMPFFANDFLNVTHPFFYTSDLDALGRTHQAIALVNHNTMFTGKRSCSLSRFNTSAWTSQRIGRAWLHHHCHLIPHQFEEKIADRLTNLITGSCFFNTSSMRLIEIQLTKQINSSPNANLLYRVTPVYLCDNLLPHGVLVEALDISDRSFSICSFIPNVQPGYRLNYANGGLL